MKHTVGIHLFVLVACVGCEAGPRVKPSPEPPANHSSEYSHTSGLHNVFPLPGGVISGSAPEGDEGFDSLEAMGVRTIISVDGGRPDVERARQRGIRYVHVPIGYNGVGPIEAERIAAALRDLPGPVYVHCHHGKHRGPTAAAVGLVEIGAMSRDDAVSFIHRAGTSRSYPGLWRAVESADRLDMTALTVRGVDLPEIAEVRGFTAAMANIDRVWERLKLVQASAWRTPDDHPDLVPAAEAGMLADFFRVAIEYKPETDDPRTFDRLLSDSLFDAAALEAALVQDNIAEVKFRFDRLNDGCRSCHESFRNPVR